jgi:hypothetical protein
MKTKFAMSLLFCVAAMVNVQASPCGSSGMTVVKAFDGQEFVIYLFRKGSDVAFQLPGADLSFPNGQTGPKRFVIDGILFEALLVPSSDFLKSKDKLSDLEILKKHREWEVDYLSKGPGSLSKFVEIGPRERPAHSQQPSSTFYLWEMINPTDMKGARQYYLSTITEGEVIVLTAILADDSKDSIAMKAFQSFASSFQLVLKKEQCPEVKK